ncbi:MAG: thermonuclease family protein [Spirochaetota bacterium]
MRNHNDVSRPIQGTGLMMVPPPALVLLIALLVCSQAAAAPNPATVEGRVVGVHDGDTITVLEGKTQYKIRLDGIDAPELSQAFGRVAKDFASAFAFGRTAKVRISGVDRYGRYLGEVFVEGKSLNKELVKAGLAWHYKQYSKDRELSALEDSARARRVGLWKDARPIPPWEYRKKK